jgi:SAM-dependent methyltransferase
MTTADNNKNLAANSYWDDGYGEFQLEPMPSNYPTVELLYKYFENYKAANTTKTVFEIGVYPGRFMYHFGKLGYTLNGIDQTKYLPRLQQWLEENNFKTGFFCQGDINQFARNEKFDVVFSAGFIEHFTDFEKMVSLHGKFVKEDGYVFITAPNFGGAIQYKLHKWLDGENLARHHVPAMNVEKWATVLAAEDFEIIFSGYIGGVDFWVDKQRRNIPQKILLKLVKWLLPVAKKMKLKNRRAWSPECVLIAKKKSHA